MWDSEQRAAFMGKHFSARQRQIQQLLGDPGKTDSGELYEDPLPLHMVLRQSGLLQDLLRVLQFFRRKVLAGLQRFVTRPGPSGGNHV